MTCGSDCVAACQTNREFLDNCDQCKGSFQQEATPYRIIPTVTQDQTIEYDDPFLIQNLPFTDGHTYKNLCKLKSCEIKKGEILSDGTFYCNPMVIFNHQGITIEDHSMTLSKTFQSNVDLYGCLVC